MTRFFLTAALTTAFGLAVLVASAATGSFAGTWALDKTKSQGLSQRLQTADKVTWTITQDDKTIAIGQKVEGGQGFGPPGGAPGGRPGGPPPGGSGPPPGGGAPPGGPAGGGAMPPMPPTVYNLDGSEANTTFDGDRGKATNKAAWAGSVLQLSRQTSFKGETGETKNAETRKLELSGDGKVLTVIFHSEGSRGTQDSTMVFNKQ